MRNPGYLGDLILFSGWAMVARNSYLLSVPLIMHLGFVYTHIPEKEAYLAERYGKQFNEYSKRVKALIPFIY